jgi:UPF0755 protein
MKKIIWLLILVLILGVIWYKWQLLSFSSNNQTVAITIKAGLNKTEIADILKKDNLISSTLAFKIHYLLVRSGSIQAGDYVIEPKTKTTDLMRVLQTGDNSSKEVSVLIREGLTAKDINNYLKTNNFLNDDSFLNLAHTPIKNLPAELKKYSWLNGLDKNDNLEGYLFPDTYRLYRNFTANDLVVKMLADLNTKLTPEFLIAVNNSGHSLKEIITMASILEKEVRTETDMKIVSGIFWDRITNGQALQSCATLAFILGVNKTQYTYADTQIDSLYNTYQHRGLPPSPISNPGLKSIGAALYPTNTNYNYFLTRPDNGQTVFSKTLEEHNFAKAEYLK